MYVWTCLFAFAQVPSVGRRSMHIYACMREDSPKSTTSDMHFCLLDLLLSTFEIKVVRNAAFVTYGHTFLDPRCALC